MANMATKRAPSEGEIKEMYAELEAYLKETFAPEAEKILKKELVHEYGVKNNNATFKDIFGKKPSHSTSDAIFFVIYVKRRWWRNRKILSIPMQMKSFLSGGDRSLFINTYGFKFIPRDLQVLFDALGDKVRRIFGLDEVEVKVSRSK